MLHEWQQQQMCLLSLQELDPPLLTVTSPFSTSPRVHPSPPAHSRSPSPRRTHYASPLSSSSHYSSPHANTSFSPRTVTVTSSPREQSSAHAPTEYAGTSPPYNTEPIQTTRDQPGNREERIRALTQSALELKKKIAAEAERLKQSRQPARSGPSNDTSSLPPSHVPPPRTLRNGPPPHGISSRADIGGVPPSFSLPGVQSVHRHAVLAEETRREAEAALRIQATFRGYRVRKSLHWQLPSGRTLGGSLGSARVGDGEEGGSAGMVNGRLKMSVARPVAVTSAAAAVMMSPPQTTRVSAQPSPAPARSTNTSSEHQVTRVSLLHVHVHVHVYIHVAALEAQLVEHLYPHCRI